MNVFEELDEINRRLDRLERLAFQTYTDVQSVAAYAYMNVRTEVSADEVKPLSGFNALQDKEALAVGLMFHELCALKQTTRTLRKQARRDSLTIIRDLLRPRKKPSERQHSPEDSEAGTGAMSSVSN